MKLLAFFALVFSLLAPQAAKAYSASDLETADKYYAEKSYQLAATEYAKLIDQPAEEPLKREVTFKWSDSVIQGKDEAGREKAEKLLQALIDGKDHDRWWAEANVSLAGHYTERDGYGKMNEIKKWLDDARDWWAGSSDTDLARPKFIGISFQLADFVTSRWGWYNVDIRPIRLGGKSVVPAPSQQQGNQSLVVLYEEILKVAKTDADKARAHYGLGMAYMQNYSGDQKLRDKAIEEFEEIVDDFDNSEWADDAYYQLGQYYENKQDFPKAVEAYRNLSSHFKTGQSQWVDDAKRRVEYITNPSLSVSVGNNFVPGSEIQFNISWRNLKNATLRFYQFDMAKELKLRDDQNGFSSYNELVQHLVQSGRYKSFPVTLSTELTLKEEGTHIPHSEYKGLAEWRREDEDDKADPKQGQLPVGAYLMVVTSGEAAPAYELVLVSDLALVSKVAKDMGLFFALDAKTGKPVPNADVKYTYSYYDQNGSTRWIADAGRTDENGLLKTSLRSHRDRNYAQHNIFAAVSSEGKQAFVQNNYYNYYYNNRGEWWLYAFTDRPAYRPNETVSFKGLLRQPKDGMFDVPAGMEVKARIYDAQGKQVKEGSYRLNDYGAFDDTLVLDDKAVLGEYRLEVYSADFNRTLSSTQLFRLEEYKLPEFTVDVKAEPKEDKTGIAAYRLGDTVEVAIDAQYYFGGPVADGDVEYLVYQNGYYRQYRPMREYGWYYEDMYPRNYGYGYGALIKQEKIKTGKDGKATFKIETPKESGDLQYHVEVRVVDKSRREIRGTSDIKVTKTAFFADLEAKQNLYRPGDKAQVLIKTKTANDDPVSVEGKVTVLRNTWREPVVKDGNVVNPAGYNGQEMLTKFVKTNARGEATFEFEPNDNGYYIVEFTGFDGDKTVMANTSVFVCDNAATNIGYRYGGLQIITEKDTYAPGETARAMIVSDVPDTYVLLTTENDNLYDYRMLHLEGSVKLVEIPVDIKHTPNVFFHAISGGNFQLKNTSLQVIVPPAEKFLNVKVTSDKAVYQPQEEGTFDIEVTDKDGKPVRGEVTIGLTDAAIYYIQGEYAQDIRQFFYGEKKTQAIQTQTSFYQRSYQNLVRGEDGSLITDEERQSRLRAGQRRDNMPVDQLRNGLDDRLERGQLGAVGGKADFANAREGAALAKSAPAPAAIMSEASTSRQMKEEDSKDKMAEKKAGLAGDESAPNGAPMQEPDRVRSDFRSTVVWLPSVVTDASGKAQVKARFPDSLTTWRLTARANTAQTAIGTVTHEVKSNKDLMIRLQAPRFFTERDLVDVSALIDNMTDAVVTVQPVLKAEGVTITGLYKDGKFVKGEAGSVEVPAHGQARVDWAVAAQKAGKAKLTAIAKSAKAADAMEKTYPVIPHGIEKFIAQSLVLKSQDGSTVTKELSVNIPKERIKEATSLRLTVSPSLAASLLDALPYLADYPYGCVEQTMSRFLPAVVVRKTMRDLGISEQDVEAYISDVLTPRGDPKGHPQRREDATYSKLNKMTADGLTRLYDFQHSDGGWGWWKDGDSDRFMTAYVVWGMALAQESAMEVRSDVLSRAAEFLRNQLVEEENQPDMLAWMLHSLAHLGVAPEERTDRQRARLWDMRNKLNPYTRALFALAEHRYGNAERSRVLARNVPNGVDEDKDNGTAHWGEAGVHYRWSDGGVEATAFSIKALSNMDPQSEYLEKAVKWMILNRRGASWKNTRDTAIAILGLADYLKATRELAPEYDFSVTVNGKTVREGKADASNVFSFDRIIDIPAEALHEGENKISVTMKGKGALYLSSHTKYFTLEEPITKAGNEIFVTRQYFKKSVKETLMKGYTEDWAPLKDGDAVKSGDRIRVDVTLEAKNHYEYLIAEDYKPAGLEAVSLTSGSGEAIQLDRDGRETQERTYVYQEFRDQKAAFFISKLKQGKHLLRYELRAEIPGEFHAMPDQAHAMYVPEIRASSDEMRLKVND